MMLFSTAVISSNEISSAFVGAMVLSICEQPKQLIQLRLSSERQSPKSHNVELQARKQYCMGLVGYLYFRIY